MPVEQREKELEKDYRLQMTEDVRKDVGTMCNYSDAIWTRAIEKGAYETILDLVRQKIISIQVAAKQLGMTEEKSNPR